MIPSKRITLFGVNVGIVIFLFFILPIISERYQVFYNDNKLPISIVVGHYKIRLFWDPSLFTIFKYLTAKIYIYVSYRG